MNVSRTGALHGQFLQSPRNERAKGSATVPKRRTVPKRKSEASQAWPILNLFVQAARFLVELYDTLSRGGG
ncbi:hypothetical protein E3G40_002756 [Mycobacteroides abscessus]|nr:hypothetical protein [Mycobacteroides abscessus]